MSWKLALPAVLMCVLTWRLADAQQEALPQAKGPAVDARHYSYAIGLDLGAGFAGDKIELDLDSLLAGIQDGLQGGAPKYPQETCAAALAKLSAIRLGALQKRNQEFLAANGKAEGVQTTDSGLQYKVIKAGSGASPGPKSTVLVHYRGKLIDGTIFDQSYGGEPVEMLVSRVIPGWTEALQKMKVGDSWQLFVPSELAYGERGAGEVIPPHATLIFEIELLNIVP